MGNLLSSKEDIALEIIFGSCAFARARDFRDRKKCAVADAVVVEPVSAVRFPTNRGKNRDYRNSQLFLTSDAAIEPMILRY
jgi:hypothetical protein